jgi:hypothetical protein
VCGMNVGVVWVGLVALSREEGCGLRAMHAHVLVCWLLNVAVVHSGSCCACSCVKCCISTADGS